MALRANLRLRIEGCYFAAEELKAMLGALNEVIDEETKAEGTIHHERLP